MLAVAGQPGHHDRSFSESDRPQERSAAAVANDKSRFFRAFEKTLGRQKRFGTAVAGPEILVMACLHEDRLFMKYTFPGQIVNGFQETREGLSGIADGYEDQRSRPP
jgi:hypothetical protein